MTERGDRREAIVSFFYTEKLFFFFLVCTATGSATGHGFKIDKWPRGHAEEQHLAMNFVISMLQKHLQYVLMLTQSTLITFLKRKIPLM